MEIPPKRELEIPFDADIPVLGIFPKRVKDPIVQCQRAAPFIIAKF